MKLHHVQGRIVVKIELEQKNQHTFLSTGQTIRLEREYNNLNQREVKQVLGEVVSSDYIPEGALLLFHHNSIHPSNEIFNHSNLSGEEIASGIKLYSIPEADGFLWKMPTPQINQYGAWEKLGEWQPLKGFATALRVFKPYKGILSNIEPTKIADVLFVLTGELKGKVVKTLKSCDYQIVFRNESGIEESIIRFRPFGEPSLKREEEAIAILWNETEKVENGEYHVGITVSDAKPFTQPPTTVNEITNQPNYAHFR